MTQEAGDIFLFTRRHWINKRLAQAQVGIGAHTDFEAFTLMHQSAPGLQVCEIRRVDRTRGPCSNSPRPLFLPPPTRTRNLLAIPLTDPP